jgi:hypothetical protein
MQNKLVSKVFEKASSEGAPKSRNGLATHIHTAMNELNLKPPTTKSIGTYHQKLEANEDYAIARVTLDSFASYLEYDDYADFIQKNSRKTVNTKRCKFLIIALLAVIGFLIYDAQRKKCMTWDGEQYVKVHCEEANAKPIDPGLLANFKKLEKDCNKDFFFNEDGSPKVWYYKRGDKDLELFSSPGIHPVKGNDLHKINDDMICKHVCDTY